MKTSKIFNFVARNVITVIIIALSNSLLSGDPIISITLVSAAILDYSRQLINATNKEKKAESKNGYNRKSYRLTISAANGLLFGAYLVCAITSERTKDSDLASAAKSLSWISPLVLLFSRIFHWCFFHETNRQKAEAFVSNLQEERLTSLIRETTLSIVDEQQEKRNTFTEGKYLLFRFLKPSAEFNFSTAEDRNQAGKLINDLYEAATLRCKAIVDEGKDVRTRDDNASALLINHH